MADGRVLSETTGMSEQLSAAIFPDKRWDREQNHSQATSSEAVFSVLSMGIPGYRLQIGLEVTFEKSLPYGVSGRSVDRPEHRPASLNFLRRLKRLAIIPCGIPGKPLVARCSG